MIHKRLWLIGGTTESILLANEIASLGLPCTITVTTKAAQTLYPHPGLQVWVGRLDANQLELFLREQQIAAILDASHPYAVEVSKMAMRIAAKQQIPYLRFERLALDEQSQFFGVISLDSFETLLAGDYLAQQRVLLTVGNKVLPLFQSWHNKATLFTRILPAVTSLESAIASGFSPNRIIALRPPITAELEKALWQQWDISLVVTKASGTAGGEEIKRSVAAELGIPLIIIARPTLDYPQQTSELSVALEFCKRYVAPVIAEN